MRSTLESITNCRDRYPDAKFVAPEDLCLLGTPLSRKALDPELQARLDVFRSTCSRLETLDHHDALFLLKNVFHIPKLLYLLRTSPCHSSPIMRDFDDCMRSTLESITNCRLDDSAFQQATLPIKFGGLGVRSTVDISLPAYIASCIKTTDTVKELLPSGCVEAFSSDLSDAVQK